jgi:hypothetical protein
MVRKRFVLDSSGKNGIFVPEPDTLDNVRVTNLTNGVRPLLKDPSLVPPCIDKFKAKAEVDLEALRKAMDTKKVSSAEPKSDAKEPGVSESKSSAIKLPASASQLPASAKKLPRETPGVSRCASGTRCSAEP